MIELNWQFLPLVILLCGFIIMLVPILLGFGDKFMNLIMPMIAIVMIFYTLYGIYYLFTHVKLI